MELAREELCHIVEEVKHDGNRNVDKRRTFSMAEQVDKLYEEASRLPLAERAALAGLLVDTLEGAVDPEVEKAWREEVVRRIAELDAGEVKTIPWQQVRSKVRSIVGLSH